MILLITGASHTGKTLLAQRLLEKYQYPYLSIDHLKMGLIRSKNTSLTPQDDTALVPYLWPIVREMIKTAIENRQNLIIEGCYIPFDWKDSFDEEYLKEIRYCCLVMTQDYIEQHFDEIKNNADSIEHRLDDSHLSKDILIQENLNNLHLCKEHHCNYLLIRQDYEAEMTSTLQDIFEGF